MGVGGKELIRMKNGAKLIERHVEESSGSVVFSFRFDKPMIPMDFLELYRLPSSVNLVYTVLQERGWLTREFRPKRIICLRETMEESDGGREWRLSLAPDSVSGVTNVAPPQVPL